MRIYIVAKCRDCKFVRNNVELTNDKFSNNAGYQVIRHLMKHSDHIMKLNGAEYKLQGEKLVACLEKNEGKICA